jgi:anaerobic ribonucleoside-triphosphate reductase activating protein
MIRIAKVHHPVTVLGPGHRLGIWVQGCSIGCAGCASRDTWVTDPALEVEVADLLDRCRELVGDGPLDGVTVTGGEPFEQPAALAALADGLRSWGHERHTAGHPELDLLVYSGLPWARLTRHHADLLARFDAAVPEPYVATAPRGGAWRGSSNQPLVPLTPLGRLRYPAGVDSDDGRPRLQVALDDDAVWFVGVPRPGDLDRLEAALAARGVTVEEVSWRP